MASIYQKLAGHLSQLTMGYPGSRELIDLLRAMFTPEEAEAALGISTDMLPLQVEDATAIAGRTGLPVGRVEDLLVGMASKRAIYSAPLASGEMGYALHQVGYGIPQSYLWGGPEGDTSAEMAKLLLKYFSVPVTREVYGSSPTKPYKYAPVGLAIDLEKQSVMPQEHIGRILSSADMIGLAHCPCRTTAQVLGRSDCNHSLEVCFKYDDMAEFVIDRKLARQVSADEAFSIMKTCEKEGLVHMVDNVQGEVKHTCNCCGHYCWNVGIIARRKIPRDVLMAVYYIRETVLEECIGCGACAGICPVEAVAMDDDSRPVVDPDWCIGCGVCMVSCAADVISMVRRHDQAGPENFKALHARVQAERQ